MSRVMTSLTLLLFTLALASCNSDHSLSEERVGVSQTGANGEPFRALVFSRTVGFRHSSIPNGIRMLQELGNENGFEVVATEDPTIFNEPDLSQFKVVIWLNTVGNVLQNDGQRQAMERFVRDGGGFVGIHAAADSEYEWDFYEELVGARFKSHPLQQLGTVVNEEPDHPSVRMFPTRWTLFEEFYSFNKSPRGQVNVLLSMDERSYFPNPNTTNLPGSPSFPFGESGFMGDHPMAWCHNRLGGIAWYTALGHESYLYSVAGYQQHVLNGVLIAAKRVAANCESN